MTSTEADQTLLNYTVVKRCPKGRSIMTPINRNENKIRKLTAVFLSIMVKFQRRKTTRSLKVPKAWLLALPLCDWQ